MRHRVKKIKVKGGKDANRMLIRKLTTSFFSKGQLRTTLNRAKILKSHIEKLIDKVKTKRQPNKNYLLVENLKNVVGGYVRVVKLGRREGDGSPMARLEWAHPLKKNNGQSQPINKTS